MDALRPKIATAIDLRSDDHVFGPDGTPLVVVYADFTCPHCAVAHERLTEIARATPHRRVFRHLALKTRHPRAVALACAAEAAAEQGAFWPFHDLLYGDPSRTDDPHLWEHCRALGLDLDRFEAVRRDDATLARVKRDTREAIHGGATSTPTIIAPPGLYP